MNDSSLPQANALRPAIIGICGPSGVGKTTLLRQIITQLNESSLQLGVIKQARADFDVDQPGKDSHVIRQAGADHLLLVAPRQSALLLEHPQQGEPCLEELLDLFDFDSLDMILVEGFSEQPFRKILLHRQVLGPLSYSIVPTIIAIATDDPELQPKTELSAVPLLNINDPSAIANFITVHSELMPFGFSTTRVTS